MRNIILVVWLSFLTQFGKLNIQKEAIVAFYEENRKSQFCTIVPTTEATYECATNTAYYVCTNTICHEIKWDKTFEELGKKIHFAK